MDVFKKTLMFPSLKVRTETPMSTEELTEVKDDNSHTVFNDIVAIDKLPSEIVLHIFSFLAKSDRLKIASVCKPWRDLIFSSPRLWRSKELTLRCSRQSKSSKKAYFYAKRLGHHLRKLTVNCEHPNNHSCRFMAVCFRKLLLGLRNPSLTSLKVTDLRLRCASQSVISKISSILAAMLASLTQLESFQMSSAQWPPAEGNLVIDRLLETSRNSLQTLQIDGYFVPRYTPYQVDRFTSGISSLVQLTKLSIDYSYLTNDSVISLAHARKGHMKKLKLVASDLSPHSRFIARIAWRTLTTNCPGMKVEFCIKGFVVSPSRSIPAILDSVLRIYKLRISIGAAFTFIDMPRLNVASVLQHITSNFRKRLVRFEMDIDNHNDLLDAALIRLVRKCKHLVSLKVLAYFASPQTDQIVRDLVRERRQRQTVNKAAKELTRSLNATDGNSDTAGGIQAQEGMGGATLVESNGPNGASHSRA